MLHAKCNSLFNGQPIKSVLAGITAPSQNRKTGPVIQQYILNDSDTLPYNYDRNQAESVCGDCPLHPTANGGCYVLRFKGAAAVAKSTPPKLNLYHLSGRVLRLGAEGDPTAIPFDEYEQLFKEVRVVLGYTHQWRNCDPRWKPYLKASVESEAAAKEAQELGWSTFRIRATEAGQPMKGEAVCRYESNRETCLECKLCSKSVNIVVTAHGANTNKINHL